MYTAHPCENVVFYDKYWLCHLTKFSCVVPLYVLGEFYITVSHTLYEQN